MKKYLRVEAWKAMSVYVVFFVGLFMQIGNLSAQPARIKHVIERLQKDNTQYLGRDLWFTMAENYIDQGGKYYALYVTSPNNTTVYIQVTGGSTSKWPITAGQIVNFTVPLAWEVTSSGVVEDKGIRVWSNDADLTAYLLSRNPATSDGMFIIPTTGWGTDYVVAAYSSLYEGYGGIVYDYPSEFSIIANQNQTICTITPSVDLRCQNGIQTVHKANVPFTEILDRGQCVQYQAMPAQDCYVYDVTGTIVKSNNPVGIVGASQCPNIPCENPYCDHICDMIPPVRTWANTYQTVPFDTRVAGDTYLVIASKDGQVINRNKVQYCVLDTKYSYLFKPDVQGPSLWESDAPFLLAQYINSTTYEAENGGSANGRGDPAMVVVNAVEQYVPHIIFQTPNIQGSNGFSNYANVMVNNNSITKTTFDGVPINSVKGGTRMPIPNSNYSGFRVAQLSPGKHEIVSDTGVGVYVYGYGSYDSYAWSGSLGIKTFNDPDTIPPIATPTGECYQAHITMTDNHKAPPASKISEMKVDSIYNMAYNPDPSYFIGVPNESTFYDMNVIDNMKEAYLKIETHDYAGNRTNVTSTYIPQLAALNPAINNYGSGNVGVTTYKYFTFTNTGTIPFDWQSIKLQLGNQGFVIDSGLVPNTPIPVGGQRTVRVAFTPVTQALRSDTLIFSDGCDTQTGIVLGTGGLPDFAVKDEDFQCQLVGSTTRLSNVIISNVSKSSITIDSITVADTKHFGFNPLTPITNNLPFTLAANAERKIEFSFMPDVTGPFVTIANIHSVEIGWKPATLKGSGCAPGAHISKDTVQVSECGTALPFLFTVQSIGSAESSIANVVITGDAGFTLASTPYTDQSGNPVNLPKLLTIGESFFVNVIYTPPSQTSGAFSANIFAIDANGDTTNVVTATVVDVFRQLDATKSIANIAAVPFGSQVKNDILTYCNTQNDSVTLQSVTAIPGLYNAAFSITGYTVNGTAATLPVSLGKGDCVNIIVQFDPSVSPDPVQTQDYAIGSNACVQASPSSVTSGVTFGPPTILGADIKPTILSCDTKDAFVTVTNSNGRKSPPMTITGITLSGQDTSNFIVHNPASFSVAGGSSIDIPVTFTPTPNSGPSAIDYTINVIVTLTDVSGKTVTLSAPVTGSANGMNVNVTSNFAVQTGSADNNTLLPLPINITFNRNGLVEQIDAFGITKITLTYQYNTDLLDVILDQNGLPKVTGLPTGWSIDPASNVNNASGTLTVILNGIAPLTDAQASNGTLGELTFTPKVTKSGTKVTTVALAPPIFQTSGGAAVGNCLAITQNGTQFSLVYECGDSTLAYFLTNGTAPSMIKPVNPNPVSASNGGIVKFQYVTRQEGIVSLGIYDELGKEAVSIVNKQFHPAGTYEVQADVSRLSSGSYIYRFQLDNHHAISGRMVVSN